MANSITYVKNYTAVLDEVYKRAACSTCLNSPRRMARSGRNAKEIMIPKIEVTGLGDYTRNVGYKTGSITYEFETKTFNYDRGIKLLADVMDVEEAGVLDCFVAAGSELQRTQMAPEADAFTFSEIAGHAGVTPATEDFADAEAEDVLASLCAKRNTRNVNIDRIATLAPNANTHTFRNSAPPSATRPNPHKQRRHNLRRPQEHGIIGASEMKTRPRRVVGVRAAPVSNLPPWLSLLRVASTKRRNQPCGRSAYPPPLSYASTASSGWESWSASKTDSSVHAGWCSAPNRPARRSSTSYSTNGPNSPSVNPSPTERARWRKTPNAVNARSHAS